jgi:hypothetical protein
LSSQYLVDLDVELVHLSDQVVDRGPIGPLTHGRVIPNFTRLELEGES